MNLTPEFTLLLLLPFALVLLFMVFPLVLLPLILSPLILECHACLLPPLSLTPTPQEEGEEGEEGEDQ